MERNSNLPAPIGLLTAITALGSVSVSLYVPSLPAIASEMAAAPGAARLTLTAFLAAFAVSQLAYGPLSDRYGRRMPILAGAAVYVAGSLACLVAPHIGSLIAARVLQAVGAAAGPALGRAIVRDVVAPNRLSGVMALMASVIALSPTLGPVAGGQIAMRAGWRADFVVLAATGAVIGGLLAWRLPETHLTRSSSPLRLGPVAATYRQLVSDRCFLFFLLCGGLLTAGNFAWVAAAPFLFIQQFGVRPAVYGLYSLLVGGGYALGALMVILGGKRISTRRAVQAGVGLAILGGVALEVAAIGLPRALPLAIAMALYSCGMGIAVPSCAAGALARHPEAAGSAAALIGGLQIAIGAMGSVAGSLVAPFGATVLATAVLSAGLLASACLLGVRSLKTSTPSHGQLRHAATANLCG